MAQKKKGTSKNNSFLYNVQKIKITKHALARFMQRTKNPKIEIALEKFHNYFNQSKLVKLYPNDIEERQFNLGKGNTVIFVCRTIKENGREIKVVLTILLSKATQIRHFGNSVNDICYEEFDFEQIRKIDPMDTI